MTRCCKCGGLGHTKIECPSLEETEAGRQALAAFLQTIDEKNGFGKNGPGKKHPNNWDCQTCSFMNFGFRKACNRCSAARQKEPKCSGKKPEGFKPGDWICQGCSNHNFSNRMSCYKCPELKPTCNNTARKVPKDGPCFAPANPPKKFRPGDWICPECQKFNFAKRKRCGKCTKIKPIREGGRTSEEQSRGRTVAKTGELKLRARLGTHKRSAQSQMLSGMIKKKKTAIAGGEGIPFTTDAAAASGGGGGVGAGVSVGAGAGDASSRAAVCISHANFAVEMKDVAASKAEATHADVHDLLEAEYDVHFAAQATVAASVVPATPLLVHANVTEEDADSSDSDSSNGGGGLVGYGSDESD